MTAPDHMLKAFQDPLASPGARVWTPPPTAAILHVSTGEKETCHGDRADWTGSGEGRVPGPRRWRRRQRVLRKTLRREAMMPFFSELAPCLVGIETCSGAHCWARGLSDLGHEVRLTSPQFVTAYVKSNKNDRNDAEAICEAVGRPSMRFVPPVSPEQMEIQAVHRIRQRLVSDRTRLVNQIRGLLAEHGVVIARDISRLRGALWQIEDGSHADDGLTGMICDLVREVREELAELDRRITSYNGGIRTLFRTNETCQRIGRIEGIGPITATALVAAVGDRTCFRNGCQFAAWLGLVPRQRSSGGKVRLFGISKRGDRISAH